MAYYDRIAKKWHQVTGYSGGAFKKLLLNDLLVERISSIQGQSILEVGAGNGYFLPLVFRRYSGQTPSRIVITDQSKALLAIAQRHFKISRAEYRELDVRSRFPFGDDGFDLILATMVFNEVSNQGLKSALAECLRILETSGMLLFTVTHPEFIDSLAKRDLLRKDRRGVLTMPGTDGLRLPVMKRTTEAYKDLLEQTGFQYEAEAVFPTQKVLNAKPGLRKAGNVPIALVCSCIKP